jgi:hypothetical protein
MSLVKKGINAMDVIFDESKFYYSVINLKPTFPEDVRHLTIHNDVLCFDIKSMILPNNGSSDENTSSIDTFMDTPTTANLCSQNSNDHCDNSQQLLDSTILIIAPVNSSLESSPTLQVQLKNSPENSLPSNLVHHVLPPRSTYGVPPAKYESDTKANVKYLISNHISSHKLSASYASYMCKSSSISIPSTLQKALENSH